MKFEESQMDQGVNITDLNRNTYQTSDLADYLSTSAPASAFRVPPHKDWS